VEKRYIPADTRPPPHRTFARGGSAAAYKDTREDHYRRVAQQRQLQNKDGGGCDSAVSLDGTLAGGLTNNAASLGALGPIEKTLGRRNTNQPTNLHSNARTLPSDDNQHYEMLKSHHMNLLNELQETTLMMKLYQQQHLQQDLQQEKINNNMLVEPQLSLLTQQQQLIAGAGGICQPGGGLAQLTDESLGLTYRRTNTANSTSGSNNNTIINHRINKTISNAIDNSNSIAVNSATNITSSPGRTFLSSVNNTKCHRESNRIDSHEISTSNLYGDELQRIKDEIVERQRMVKQIERMKPNQKRPKREELM